MATNIPQSGEERGACTRRLFIALPLPEDIRREVAGLSENLQKGARFTPCRPSWSSPESMHLTLLFLGATPEDKIEPIKRALDALGPGFCPQRLEIKRLGVFPNWRAPRVLWAGIRDRTHQLGRLQQTVERAMVALGYQPEEKEFHPHLTLARFKSLKGTAMIEKIVDDHQGFRFGPFFTPEVILYQSELHPAGTIHTPLHRIALTAPPPSRPETEE